MLGVGHVGCLQIETGSQSGQGHGITFIRFPFYPQERLDDNRVDDGDIDPHQAEGVEIQEVIVGGAFDDHKFHALREKPFGGFEGIFAMLVELTGFQITGVGMKDGGDDDVLVGITSPGEGIARMNPLARIRFGNAYSPCQPLV